MTNQVTKPSKGTSKQLGKAGRPKIDLDEVLRKTKEFLNLGYSLHKACMLGNVAYSTVKPYYNDDEDFRNRVERERTDLALQARRNIEKAIREGKDNLEISKDWLERLEPDDFSKVHKVKDETPQDEGVVLLREIIAVQRLEARKAKALEEGEKD